MKLTGLSRNKTKNFIGLALGLGLIIAGFYFSYTERVLSFDKAPEYRETVAGASLPIQIKIENLGVDLPVTEARIENGVWEISEIGASHLDVSARPGSGGNVVIYGHNKADLFGPLLRIKVGNTVEVTADNGEIFIYAVEEVFETSPSRVEVIAPRQEETLTLYTCSGFLDTKRLVVVARPI